MNELHESILDAEFEKPQQRRRDLLPTWIKVFIWIFMILGGFISFGLLAGIAGIPFTISVYGFSTITPFSIVGLSLIGLSSLKSIVAFGLWTEKEWAVDIAIVDAIIGIVICIFASFILPVISSSSSFTVRLEILFLIPYYFKMKNIKQEWLRRIEL